MAKTRRTFSTEFKLEAAQLVVEQQAKQGHPSFVNSISAELREKVLLGQKTGPGGYIRGKGFLTH